MTAAPKRHFHDRDRTKAAQILLCHADLMDRRMPMEYSELFDDGSAPAVARTALSLAMSIQSDRLHAPTTLRSVNGSPIASLPLVDDPVREAAGMLLDGWDGSPFDPSGVRPSIDPLFFSDCAGRGPNVIPLPLPAALNRPGRLVRDDAARGWWFVPSKATP